MRKWGKGGIYPAIYLCTNAQFGYSVGVAAAPNGTVYVADTNNQRIRKIT